MTGPFAAVAVEYQDAGLCPFPCGGDDGKRPLVRNWQKPHAVETIRGWAERHPAANVGVPTGGVTSLTVVDCDDCDLAGDMLQRCGDTPLMTQTPRGGIHLFYRHAGEQSVVGLDGEKIDIRGAGGLVVAPPSIRPDTGKTYSHLNGDFRDLPHLPEVKPGSLPTVAENNQNGTDVGRRAKMLFARLRAIGNAVADADELALEARDINRNFTPPLSDAEVMRTVASVWKYRTEGRLVAPKGGTFAHFSGHVLDLLHGEHDARSLLADLQRFHGVRREPFALAAHACAETFGMSHQRIRRARDVLIERGLLEPVHPGGRGKGDPATFRLNRHSLSHPQGGGGV